MPEPGGLFEGLKPGQPQYSERLRQLGGEDFWSELTNFQAGRSMSGPRAGYNYRTKKERDPKTAKDIQDALDLLYGYWEERGWQNPAIQEKSVTMKKKPEYSGGLPSTVGETNPELLKQLLNQ